MAHKVQLRFSYEIVTPESAEFGDVAERGWYFDGGHFASDDELASEGYESTARDALTDIEQLLGVPDEVSVRYYGGEGHLTCYPADSCREDYRTGAETYYHAHVSGHPRLIAAMARALGAE